MTVNENPDLPLISVILPVYNNADTVARSIHSALAQNYPSYEIIAIDDGSGDGSREAVAEFGDALRLISQQHAGPSAARNRAIRESKGEFLAFLDADDEWLPERLAKCVQPMLENDRVGMTYCWAIERGPGGAKMEGHESIRGEEFESARVFPRVLWPSAKHTTPGTTIRRSVFEKTAGFPTEFCAWRDYALYGEIAEITEVIEIDEPLVIVHISDSSFTRTVDEEQSREAYFQIVRNAFNRCPDLYEPHRRTIIADMYFFWGKRYFANENYSLAREFYGNSLRQRVAFPVFVAWLKTFAPRRLIERARGTRTR